MRGQVPHLTHRQWAGQRMQVVQQHIDAFCIKVVNDNCWSGHLLLHVISAANAAGKYTQKKTLTVRRRGFNSYDDTESLTLFEVIQVTLRQIPYIHKVNALLESPANTSITHFINDKLITAIPRVWLRLEGTGR